MRHHLRPRAAGKKRFSHRWPPRITVQLVCQSFQLRLEYFQHFYQRWIIHPSIIIWQTHKLHLKHFYIRDHVLIYFRKPYCKHVYVPIWFQEYLKRQKMNVSLLRLLKCKMLLLFLDFFVIKKEAFWLLVGKKFQQSSWISSSFDEKAYIHLFTLFLHQIISIISKLICLCCY